MLGGADDFMYLYREGVRSRDLEQLAEESGEKQGRKFDLERQLKESSEMGVNGLVALKIHLAIAKWQERRTLRKLEIAEQKAGSKIDLLGDPRGVVVAETLQRLEMSGDEDVARYVRLFEESQLRHHMVEATESALREMKA